MPFQKRIDPTHEQQKKLKDLFIYGYSKCRISKIMNVSQHLIHRWFKLLKLRKINTCNWCGRKGSGKKIGKKWLCKKCNKNRCKHCKIILSKTRTNKYGNKLGDFYKEHPRYCKSCWDKLSTGTTDKSIDKKS